MSPPKYNGKPTRCSDDKMPWGKDNASALETKLFCVCHAESNAITYRTSNDLRGCTMFATLFPCNAARSSFNSWINAKKLIINTTKPNIMLFKTTARNKDNMDIGFNKDKIKRVRDIKSLRIRYNNELLKCGKELAALDSSILSACYSLRSLRDELSITHLKMAYSALIESKLRNSIQYSGTSYYYMWHRAFILQERAMRTIFRISQRDSCRPYFKALGILTVPSLYVEVFLNRLRKYRYGYETDEDILVRETTHRKAYNKFIASFGIAKHSPEYNMAVKIFNKLPLELKSIVYTGSFKARLKTFLLEKCLYSLDDL